MPSSSTSSFTGRSPWASRSRICRRRGSATALNASVVVAARATPTIVYPYGNMSTGLLDQRLEALEQVLDNARRGAPDEVAADGVGGRLEGDALAHEALH